ncbi:MAG: DHHW family protein [Oscillospiraceae bacterium]|nr:DHHW family protein [Oscillospiraceae bacterium]
MLTSSMLGNDNNEIDIDIPDEQAVAEDSMRKAYFATAAKRKQRREQATAAHPVKKKSVQQAKAERIERNAALRGLMHSIVRTDTAPAAPIPIIPAPDASQPDLMERIKAAEEQHIREKERIAAEQQNAKAAALRFAADTANARPFARKLKHQTDKQWQKEAAAIAYEQQKPVIAKRMAVLNIAICCTVVLVIAVGMLILERPTISETENRTLAKMPHFSWNSYLNGNYTAGVAEYYNDTVPMREQWKLATATFRKYMAWQSNGPVIHGGRPESDGDSAEQTTATSTTTAITTVDPDIVVTTTSATTTVTTSTAQQEEHQGELSNNILIYENRGIMLYGGSLKNGERYARFVNAYKEKLGDSVNIYSMVVPTPCSFYTPADFQYLIGSEEKNIQHINEHLVGVTPVDAYGALDAHKDEMIYMRTDHHWSALGAFYAAERFAATARVPFAKIDSYEKVTKEGYVGTLYGYSGDVALKNNPESFFYYQPQAAYTTTYWNPDLTSKRKGSLLLNLDNLKPVSWYMVYLGGDARITHVATEVNNDRTLVIIKDSYGNALVPWLTSSFENIYVVDLRYFEQNIITYIQDVGATDVLFAMNTFSATGGNAKHINTLMNQ